MLRQVQSDRSNLAHGWLPFAADSITAVWHSDAARGPSTPSLDHLVDATNQRQRDAEAERLGGRHVDDELDFGRLPDRQLGGFLAFENSACIDSEWAVRIQNGAAVSHQATSGYKLAKLVDRGHPVTDRQCGELFAAAVEQCIGADHKCAGPQLNQGGECRIDFAFAARMHVTQAPVCEPPPPALSLSSRQERYSSG